MIPALLVAVMLGSGVGQSLAGPAQTIAAMQSVFLGTHSAPDLSALDGVWLDMTALAGLDHGPAGAGDMEAFLDQFCARDPVPGAFMADALGAAAFALTGSDGVPFTERFDWLGGNHFLRSFDPDALAARLSLTTNDAVARVLAEAPRDAYVFRPAGDVLVIVSAGQTRFLARCP